MPKYCFFCLLSTKLPCYFLEITYDFFTQWKTDLKGYALEFIPVKPIIWISFQHQLPVTSNIWIACNKIYLEAKCLRKIMFIILIWYKFYKIKKIISPPLWRKGKKYNLGNTEIPTWIMKLLKLSILYKHLSIMMSSWCLEYTFEQFLIVSLTWKKIDKGRESIIICVLWLIIFV